MHIYIKSMSESQSRIYDKLTEMSWKIDEHLIKLLLLPNCQEANHWKREVVRFVDKIDKLKGKNRWPSSKFIFKGLSTHNDMAEQLLNQVSSDLVDPGKRQVTVPQVLAVLEGYQKWLAETLSANGIIYYDDAYRVIDELIR